MSNPRCDFCLRPKRRAVVRVTIDGIETGDVELCRMHFGRQVAMGGVQIVEWLNEVARREWEDDVAAGMLPEVPHA